MDEGKLSPGDALPSIARLCEHYDASLGVVKSAISVLRTEGRVVGQQGKGIFVTEHSAGPASTAPPGDEGRKRLSEILAAVQSLGERVADLEETVFGELPRSGRSGT